MLGQWTRERRSSACATLLPALDRRHRLSTHRRLGNSAGAVVVGVADASLDELIKRLTQRMLRKKLYVVLSKGGATAEQLGAVLPKHLEYMIGLEKKGVLFASGPLTTPPGAPAGDGITILRAANADEARQIASVDPFVINKLRTFEVREWTVMEGSIGVTVNLSDQTLQLT